MLSSRLFRLLVSRNRKLFFPGKYILPLSRKNRQILLVRGGINRIRRTFVNHPLLSNVVALGGLYVGAEFSQQTIYQIFVAGKSLKSLAQDGDYDYDSLKRYAILGLFLYPLLFHFWYKWLDKAFASTAGRVVAKKVLLDQFVLGPPSLGLFFVSMSALEGQQDVFQELREKFAKTYAVDCLFWMPVQAANFAFVSPTFRVAFIGAALFVWLNILCTIKSVHLYTDRQEE